MSEPQIVDPAVSRRKFYREIAQFRRKADEYGRRGWFLTHAKFPYALVILATAKTQPTSVLCGVWFDYSNYDASPPSVQLVHPLTREPYKFSELPTQLPKRQAQPEAAQAHPSNGPQLQLVTAQPLMQAHGNDEIPFLCIAGVKEYHEHPAHTGDHWDLYRTSGAGRLVRLVEIISKYGLETIESFEVQMVPKVMFHCGMPPE